MLTKVRVVKAMVFPVVTSRYNSWTIKKTECQRINAFKQWCWRRLLRVLYTARRSSQSILTKGYSSPGSSVHGIFQTRILERVAISFSRGSSWSRDQTQVSCSADKLFTWATKDTCILIVQVNIWGTTFTGLTRITHLSLINHFVFLGQYTVPGSGSLSSNPEIGDGLVIKTHGLRINKERVP